MKYEEFQRLYSVKEEIPSSEHFDPGTIMLKIFDKERQELRAQVCGQGKVDAQAKLRTLVKQM